MIFDDIVNTINLPNNEFKSEKWQEWHSPGKLKLQQNDRGCSRKGEKIGAAIQQQSSVLRFSLNFL
jgi:hypothetical protein